MYFKRRFELGVQVNMLARYAGQACHALGRNVRRSGFALRSNSVKNFGSWLRLVFFPESALCGVYFYLYLYFLNFSRVFFFF